MRIAGLLTFFSAVLCTISVEISVHKTLELNWANQLASMPVPQFNSTILGFDSVLKKGVSKVCTRLRCSIPVGFLPNSVS